MVGQFPGGLAHTNIVASMFFAGVSGAALADTAAIGSMIIPAMIKNGYDRKFSAVITASSSIVGPIIPPSVAMIIYAYAAPGDVSIGGLFMCGAIPGVLLGVAMMVLTHFYAIRRNYPVNKAGFDIKQVFVRGFRAFWGLLIPVIILLGIMGGVFTPTEAGAIAAVYGLFVGFVIKKRLTWKLLKECLLECSIISAVIFLVLGCAKIITYTLSIYQAPEAITAFLQGLTANPVSFSFSGTDRPADYRICDGGGSHHDHVGSCFCTGCRCLRDRSAPFRPPRCDDRPTRVADATRRSGFVYCLQFGSDDHRRSHE